MRDAGMGGAVMLSAPTCEELLNKLDRGEYSDSGGGCRLIVFNPDEERLEQARSIVRKGEPNRGTYDIWFSYTSLLADGGRIAYVFPGFWDQVVTETDSLSDACDLPRMDRLIAAMKPADANGVYYQRRYNTKWLCKRALEKLGVAPDMYLGYSLGEWEAALFAGIIHCDIDEWTENFASGWDSYEHYYPLILVDGADRTLIDTWCREIPDLYMSIDNCPSQVILTGTEPALAAVTKILEEKDILHVVIPQRTALHTPLVSDILGDKFTIFREVEIGEGYVPVWSSTTLEPVPTEREAYLDYLFAELTKTVRFREAVEKLYEEQHVRVFIQIGPGPLPDYVADTLHGKDFGAVSTSITARDGADQLRRVMALLYIEGGDADAGLIGVTPHGLPAADGANTREDPSQDRPLPYVLPGAANSIAEAAYKNIQNVMSLKNSMMSLQQDMMSIQLEMAELFGGSTADLKMPDTCNAGRKGMKFEETFLLAFDDHPYLIDHSIIRQPKDWPIWEDMNPVVPFTMIIELFAELAMKHAPGEKLIKIRNVMAYKWIEVVTPLDIAVKGEWSGQDTLRLSFEGYASAECVFAAGFPTPDVEFESDIDLGKEIGTAGETEQWYEKFTFHGPRYRSLVRYDKICERGVVGIAENKGGKGSLLDSVGQLLGLFVNLTQTTNTIVFPVSLKELDLYADIHDQEGVFEDTMIVTKITDSSAATDTVVKRDGVVWCVVRGLVLQRFVSTPSLWQVILDPRHAKLASEIAPGVYFYENTLQDSLLAMLTKRYLSKPERDYYDSLPSPRQRRENLISRIALKDAVRASLAGADGEMMYPIEFSCVHDDKGRPCLRGYGDAAGKVENLHISLSHKGNAAAAIVSDGPVGIDVEKIEEKSTEFTHASFTEKERELLAECDQSDAVIRFWVAKEAYSKMLGEGLRGNPKRYEISAFDAGVLLIGDVPIHICQLGDYIVGWTPSNPPPQQTF